MTIQMAIAFTFCGSDAFRPLPPAPAPTQATFDAKCSYRSKCGKAFKRQRGMPQFWPMQAFGAPPVYLRSNSG